jgi:hypothetical protein
MVNEGEKGVWEDWSSETNYAGYFMTGAKVKMGKEKRTADKTGANGLKISTVRMFYQDGTSVI